MTMDAIDRRSSARTRMLSIAWACLMLAPATSALAEPTVEQQAEDAMHEGIDFLRSKQLPEAEAKFEQAWKLKKTTDIAANLGSTELKLARYRDAAEHLWFSLATLPLTSPQKARAAIESELAEAKKHVGQLTLDVAPRGAEVKVDDVQLGVAPLAAPVFVEPGTHKVSAAHPGSLPGEWTVTLKAGEEVAKTFRLEPAPQEGTGGAGPIGSGSGAIVPPPPPTARPVWPWVVGGGVAVAGVVVGAALQGVASGKVSTAAQAWKTAGTCASNPTTSPCLEGKQSNDAANQLKVGSYVAFGVGGVGLAVGAILYAVLPPKKLAPRATLVVPIISPSLGGLSVSHSF